MRHVGSAERRRLRNRLRSAAVAAALVAAGCIADRQQPQVSMDPCTAHPCDVAAVVAHLGTAYTQRSFLRFEALLHDDCRFITAPNPDDPMQLIEWGRIEELRIHRRMFEPMNVVIGPPTHPSFVRVHTVLTPTQPFAERPEYYYSTSNPSGLDPMRWKAWGAVFDTDGLFETGGDTDYCVAGRAWFVVAQDLTKSPGDANAFQLYVWHDLGSPSTHGEPLGATTECVTWTMIKRLFGGAAASARS